MKVRYRFLILFIIVGIVAAVLMNMGIFDSEDVPKKIKDQIMTLETDNYDIASVRDNGHAYVIRLDLLTQPTEESIETWVHMMALRVHQILVDEEVTRDIVIQARRQLTEGMVIDYGTGYYYAISAETEHYNFVLPENKKKP